MLSSNLYFATLWFVTVKIYVFRVGWRSSPHIWPLYMVTIFQLKYGETNILFCLQKYTKQTYSHAWLKFEKGVMDSSLARMQVKVWIIHKLSLCMATGQLIQINIVRWESQMCFFSNFSQACEYFCFVYFWRQNTIQYWKAFYSCSNFMFWFVSCVCHEVFSSW